MLKIAMKRLISFCAAPPVEDKLFISKRVTISHGFNAI